MKCVCGCGKKVRGREADLNLQAARMALELLAWDKARVAGYLGPASADDAERVMNRGADCYQRALAAPEECRTSTGGSAPASVCRPTSASRSRRCW